MRRRSKSTVFVHSNSPSTHDFSLYKRPPPKGFANKFDSANKFPKSAQKVKKLGVKKMKKPNLIRRKTDNKMRKKIRKRVSHMVNRMTPPDEKTGATLENLSGFKESDIVEVDENYFSDEKIKIYTNEDNLREIIKFLGYAIDEERCVVKKDTNERIIVDDKPIKIEEIGAILPHNSPHQFIRNNLGSLALYVASKEQK